jgi:hypothetical protein
MLVMMVGADGEWGVSKFPTKACRLQAFES